MQVLSLWLNAASLAASAQGVNRLRNQDEPPDVLDLIALVRP